MENKIPIRFFILTFLWSWVIWGIVIFLEQGNLQNAPLQSFGIEFILTVLGVFGPAIGAILSIYYN